MLLWTQGKLSFIVPFNVTDYSNLSSNLQIVNFEFTNSIPSIVSYSLNAYVIVNQLKNFTINFSDIEQDNVLVSIVSPGTLNAYIQKNQSNSTYLLIVEADQGANTKTSVKLKYTDSYHQDAQFWQNITMPIDIFASNPPEYTDPLQNVSVSAWGWLNVTLPTATDPDGDTFTTNLSQLTPEWIKLFDATTLSVWPDSSNLSKSLTVQPLGIVLVDSTGAQSTNTFYINVDTSELIEMNTFSNIKLYYSQIYKFSPGIVNATDISLVDWSSLQSIVFSSFNASSGMMLINASNSNDVGVHWVKLSALDGWDKVNYSNSFNLKIKIKNPPVFLKAIDPISIMKGDEKLIIYYRPLYLVPLNNKDFYQLRKRDHTIRPYFYTHFK